MKEIKSILLDNLLLDIKNPRIYQDISTDITQINLTKYIYDNFGISDLKDSILKNGYFPVEPMVVIPSIDIPSKFIVVEGNRRLTTIKILCNDEYRNNAVSIGRRDDFKADTNLIKRLKTIPVVVADDRESVNAYLGVRHLGGVVRWEPLAQSKYVYSQIVEKRNATSLIADSINKFIEETNNKRPDVLNHFYKYCIYQSMRKIIEDNREINASIDNKFSLLEVALGKSGKTSIAKYIGIDSYNRLDPEDYEDIIQEDYEDKTKNLIKWVFSDNPVIQESREINKYLKPILNKPVSTLAFEQGEDKDSALLLSDSYDNIIKKSCTNIHRDLTHIQQNWVNTKPETRSDLKEIYNVNVTVKVQKTNLSIDLD